MNPFYQEYNQQYSNPPPIPPNPMNQMSNGYGPPAPPPPQFHYSQGDIYGQNQSDIPQFKLISRGNGIDNNEFYVITHAAYEALNAREDPLSNGIIKRIKSKIGGEWMAFASIEGLKGYDFSLSIVTGNDFLSFLVQNFRFQICRLRD